MCSSVVKVFPVAPGRDLKGILLPLYLMGLAGQGLAGARFPIVEHVKLFTNPAQSSRRMAGWSSAAIASSAVSPPPATSTAWTPKASIAQPDTANPTGSNPNEPR
jgi:hypothetical protein